MVTGTLEHLKNSFATVGWFLPPYVAMGFLRNLAVDIQHKGRSFSQDDLQRWLAKIYGADELAAMVCCRYPATPVIAEYKETIAESIEAHFLGLHHVAASGLVPVVEGACRELFAQRNLKAEGIRGIFKALAIDCKKESIERNIGATGEIVSMMDSFENFTTNVLYVNSHEYPFFDGTNRHGITHGFFRDEDYGTPLNFYKIIGAVDFLAFVSAFRADISWFAPSATADSKVLAQYYRRLFGFRLVNKACSIDVK